MGRSLVLDGANELEDGGREAGDTAVGMSEKTANELFDRIDSIPDVCACLANINSALGDIFTMHFGISALSAGREPPAVYRRLFVQVCFHLSLACCQTYHQLQLTVEESILQMANRPALSDLAMFLVEPIPINASRLVGIPSLYEVLQYHQQKNEAYPKPLLMLCQWIYAQGQEVLNRLLVSPALPVPENMMLSDKDWLKVYIQ
jgi:hypothetical protein